MRLAFRVTPERIARSAHRIARFWKPARQCKMQAGPRTRARETRLIGAPRFPQSQKPFAGTQIGGPAKLPACPNQSRQGRGESGPVCMRARAFRLNIPKAGLNRAE